MKNKSKEFITPSKISPKSSKKGCLCKDNTYKTKCCDGSLRAPFSVSWPSAASPPSSRLPRRPPRRRAALPLFGRAPGSGGRAPLPLLPGDRRRNSPFSTPPPYPHARPPAFIYALIALSLSPRVSPSVPPSRWRAATASMAVAGGGAVRAAGPPAGASVRLDCLGAVCRLKHRRREGTVLQWGPVRHLRNPGPT